MPEPRLPALASVVTLGAATVFLAARVRRVRAHRRDIARLRILIAEQMGVIHARALETCEAFRHPDEVRAMLAMPAHLDPWVNEMETLYRLPAARGVRS